MSLDFIDHHLAKSATEVTKANTADEVWKLVAAPEVLGSCESPVEAVEAGVVVVVVVGFNARHSEALVEPLHMLSKMLANEVMDAFLILSTWSWPLHLTNS